MMTKKINLIVVPDIYARDNQIDFNNAGEGMSPQSITVLQREYG